jgi:hypothetical protein
MKYIYIALLLTIFNISLIDLASAKGISNNNKTKTASQPVKKRQPKYHYAYIDREHTRSENWNNIGFIYALSWGLYPLTQPEVFRDAGSWDKYKSNFGKVVFDRDEPIWNWVVHPISGSQLFLYYRANGYNRAQALGMTFISSTLFEFTIEIYTEPASVQDLYQTPVIGSLLGVGIETISMALLNTGNPVGKFFGHLMNPATLFWFYEGRTRITPYTNGRDKASLQFVRTF